jgi:hypothetical protein
MSTPSGKEDLSMTPLLINATRLAALMPGVRLACGRRLVVLLYFALVLPSIARAQESIVATEPPGPSAELHYDLSDAGYCDDHPLDAFGSSGIPWPRFGMYLKAGPSFQLGESLFQESTAVGYEINFGGREPLFPSNRQVFVDIGGSYLSAFGRGRPHTISGVIDRAGLGSQRLNEFMDLTLEEVSRASVHAAVGWHYNFSDVPEISRLVTMRFGGRISHIHGHFREDATDALQTAIDTANLLGISFTLNNDQLISKTDTAPGIFGGIELANTHQIARGATISFLIDTELASDWIDLKNYADGALVTASVMFGLSVNR